MGRILESLANGNFCAQITTLKRTAEHQEACDTAYSLIDRLQQKLSEHDNTLLNETLDAVTDANSYSEASQFVTGFKLGALLMLEICEEAEDLYEQFNI